MKASILVVDDERAICLAISRLLRAHGYEVDTAPSAEAAVEKLEQSVFHLIITDLSMGKMSGMDLLEWVRQHSPETAAIMITAYGSEKTAVEAMKLGASDYVPKPFDNDELELKVARVLETMANKRENRLLREQVESTYRFENLIGKSPSMQRVFDVIRRVADSDLTVLVRGPSGTGKELVANAIHYNSPRRGKALVKVNCAAFSRELVESELFGHEKGSFTGATATKEGKFEISDGGTLFLDEIGDMALETQAKILRVLQEKELERVGGNKTIKVDVRIIAATNQDLEAKTKQGTFREDLFYRLNVVPILLPALKDRPGDMPLLITHLVEKAADRLRRPKKNVSPTAMRALLAHEWKGNVRELEHAIEQAVVLGAGEEIELADLPGAMTSDTTVAAVALGGGGDNPQSATFKEAKQRVVEGFERQFIEEALDRHNGNISKAAEEMGMYRQHLQGKLSEYGIDAAVYRNRKKS
ncbi:MAG: sigma-54 dependent transcriptional regulator [Candidatus Binatia bacterium]|nr:sigma-54 dependent transcriptional regulator [Candidatus Binatia bacterium]